MCIANLLHPQILHKIGWLKNYVTCSDVSVSGSIGLFWVVVSALPILFTKNISQIMIIFVISLAYFYVGTRKAKIGLFDEKRNLMKILDLKYIFYL